LYLCEDRDFFPNETVKINIGVKFNMPQGYIGKIYDKSSIVNTFNLHVIGGVIDCDYKGCIYVNMRNMGNEIILLPAGHAIAQIIFHKVGHFNLKVNTNFDSFQVRNIRGILNVKSNLHKRIRTYKNMRKYATETSRICKPASPKFTSDSDFDTCNDLGDYDLSQYNCKKNYDDVYDTD